MKKIKLLSCLSFVSALAVAMPVFTTACNNDKQPQQQIITMNINKDAWYVKPTKTLYSTLYWTQKENVDFGDMNDKIWNEIDNNGIYSIENNSDPILNATWSEDFKAINIHPSAMGDFKLEFKVTFAKDQDPTQAGNVYVITSNIVVKDFTPAKEENELIYDGRLFELADNIDVNLFTTWDASAGIKQTYPLKNGGSLTIDYNADANKLTSVSLGSVKENTTTIPNAFLKYCSNLSYIDLSGLCNVTTVGDDFLFGCGSLTFIDLAPLSNVRTIGSEFIGCSAVSNLPSIDLSPLSQVRTIGDNFLHGNSNTAFTSLDLSPLSKVTSVGNGFLRQCSKLVSLDLSPMKSLESIGNSFLYLCANLKTLTFPDDWKVTSIGDDFLWKCTYLETLHLTNNAITSIGSGFLKDCSTMSSITFPENWCISTIGNEFLSGCKKISDLTIPAKWANITSIGNGFLFHCDALGTLGMNTIPASVFPEGDDKTSFVASNGGATLCSPGVWITTTDGDNYKTKFYTISDPSTSTYRSIRTRLPA